MNGDGSVLVAAASVFVLACTREIVEVIYRRIHKGRYCNKYDGSADFCAGYKWVIIVD